jgi:hypothetical protein
MKAAMGSIITIAAFFAAAIVMMRGGDGVRRGAGSGVLRLQFPVAHVVAVRVAQQHDMHVAEPWIRRAGDRLSGIVEDAHAGGILEDRRAVAVAQLTGVRAQRCDLHVLRPDCGTTERKDNRQH